MRSIQEIFEINNADDLTAARIQFEKELHEKLRPLKIMLQQNIMSKDVTSIELHMTEVERSRVNLVTYYGLVAGFVEHAKDSTFLISKVGDGDVPKKVTDTERDAYRRKMAGGFVALQIYLDGMIDSVDSRVNLCKKLLGFDSNDFSGKRS